VKEYVSRNDELQCIRIAVDRFFKATLSLVRFLIDFSLEASIYPATGKIDFLRRIDVDSTSKSIYADMVYFSTLNQRQNFRIHEACRFTYMYTQKKRLLRYTKKLLREEFLMVGFERAN